MTNPALFTAISTGLTAFTATNLDDIIMLLLFFSQVNALFQRRHIVAGQYLGFTALVLASLPGFFGSLLLPRPWIGLLGIVPIAIGLNRLLNPDTDAEEETITLDTTHSPWAASFLSPYTYSVAAITFANGGDNIGIYMPLFASSTPEKLLTILGIFFTLVGVWCYAADRLTRLPAIAQTLTRYGNQLVPYVLIGLGVLILIDSHTLENRGLTVLVLVVSSLSVLMLRHSSRSTESGVVSNPGTEVVMGKDR
ncbi:transporter [Leptolyngbya sp. 'hensonii']|uniref:cadmium resistance transporter n=1 Tax=Leptolyngbya sp. 'hensonii' TaxID=1922337 RepID=UPI00094FB43D|nr:cadmium resistance transporter [Leptolyngbya sp. 'hensonii']OLP17066.1 transporter [Leptolyngbya sp. 'hensonii']